MPHELWILHDVTLPGDGRNRLDQVTLRIETGVTAIIGYSGAGKTSLLNLLAGMEKRFSGDSIFATKTAANQTDLPLFWVPQDGGLWPHMTAREHLTAVAPPGADFGWLPQSSAVGDDAIDNLLREFDLFDRQHALPGQMSRGEQSRLSVARCLAVSPAVMLMDEPLSHTDPVRRPHYWNMIRLYVDSSAGSLILTTHEPEVVIRESSTVICLNEGRVIFAGTTTQLYDDPPTEEAGRFLGALNWFESTDGHWLPQSTSTAQSFRPEQLRLITDSSGDLEILSFRFSGSYAETRLRHVASDEIRIVHHRPCHRRFETGQKVRIQIPDE